MHMMVLRMASAAVMLCQVSAAQAALPVIDDFTTGYFYRPTPDGTTSKTYKGANIAGGARTLDTYVNTNPFAQYSAVAVGRGQKKANVGPGLFVSTGYGIVQRANLTYGRGKPMSLDLSAYARFRVHFSNASVLDLADFQAYTGSVHVGWGCNSVTTNGYDTAGEVTVDYPFIYGAGVDYTNVTNLVLILQTNANLSVKEIEVVTAGTPPADFTCAAG